MNQNKNIQFCSNSEIFTSDSIGIRFILIFGSQLPSFQTRLFFPPVFPELWLQNARLTRRQSFIPTKLKSKIEFWFPQVDKLASINEKCRIQRFLCKVFGMKTCTSSIHFDSSVSVITCDIPFISKSLGIGLYYCINKAYFSDFM